ncbi:hypothetical protein [Sinorhizobium americanum]|uniref:hypothetical protein n=1 Tax=Sinorhizobium americanum TaxID=194963 RepID=UPI00056385EF|nr:hypothetical protein [Sinorhizobium americanum]
MKTPQRRFVVEFKSGRRQSKGQTNSIWGDTDLKALAREVEQKAPHLFNSHEAPATPNPAETTPADPVSAGSGIERVGTEAEMPEHEADRPAAEAVVQVQESQRRRTTATGTPRKRTKRAPAQATLHRSMRALEDESGQPQAATDPIPFDGLATLDAENKRLKRLLVEQLQAQNLQLKKMLERFDAT